MKKRLPAGLVVLTFGLLLLFFAGHQSTSTNNTALTITDYKLNTYVSVTIYDSKKEYVLEECMKLCDKYELIFSRTNPNSELYQLNHGLLPRSKDGYYTVSSDLYHAVSVGKEYATLSDNAFSIAMEPLTSLWNFTDGTCLVPDDSDIDASLSLLNSENILLKEPRQIAFSNTGLPYTDGTPVNYGMGIDLGALAKGYIADRLKDYLLSEGIDSALIYLGGNVLCIGSKPENPDLIPGKNNNPSLPFSVGIEKPFDANNEAVAILKISDTSVVTSGTYQRYFEKDGTLYHHILNSTTGYPHQNGLTAVTIVTKSSTDADALSTTCFALGLEKGLELLESLDYADGFFITENGEYHYTNDFFEKYQVSILQ